MIEETNTTQGLKRTEPIFALQTGGQVNKILPWLFLVVSLPIVMFCALVTPPFQPVDEGAHFMRADQFSMGQLIAKRIDERKSGGLANAGITEVARLFDGLFGNPAVRVNPDTLARARAIPWRTPIVLNFPGSALYPPFLYIPSIAAIITGKAFELSVVNSLVLARMLTGFASVAIAFWALSVISRGRLIMFALLCLPMTLGQFASSSQDGLLISLTALSIATLTSWTIRTDDFRSLIVSIVAMGLVVTARPSYAPLLILHGGALASLILRFWRSQQEGHLSSLLGPFLAFLIALTIPVAWIIFGARPAQIEFKHKPGVSSADQIHFLFSHPVTFAQSIVDTLWQSGSLYARQFVGILGWVDVYLPLWFYPTAWVIIATVATAEFIKNGFSEIRLFFAAAIVMLGSTVLTFALMYVTWNEVGARLIEGIQGRYFIPLAMLACLLVGRNRVDASPLQRLTYTIGAIAVMLISLASIMIVPHAVFTRYVG